MGPCLLHGLSWQFRSRLVRMADSVSSIKASFMAAPPEGLGALIAAHGADPRPGVRDLIARAGRRLEAADAELARLEALCRTEWDLLDAGVLVVAGVDEVGRGALAGPVTAGACVLPREAHLPGINDSKLLSPARRERLAEQIIEVALGVSVGHASPAEIDTLGMTRALATAMKRALEGLPFPVGHVLLDGHPLDLGAPTTAIVKGDSSVRAIAAASIIAKVTRDRLMVDLDAEHPGYGFAGNKGYGSADHLAALRERGPSPVHRRSFSPCVQSPLF